MNIQEATHSYESWLGEQLTLIQADLENKHQQMAEGSFPFLRATFYRWAQLFPDVCADIAGAPKLLSVGDLHVENFGTWRDSEGRLIWGVNDFDEAYVLPYTNDLVRLAASARFACDANHLKITLDRACQAIMDGYVSCIDARGRPFALADRHHWLYAIALNQLRDPEHFWDKLTSMPKSTEELPGGAIKALKTLWPELLKDYEIRHRIAGLGSLGRERWVAIGEWYGGKIAREVKPLASSACAWADSGGSLKILYTQILGSVVRTADPFVLERKGWLVRRLSPDCSRIELAQLPEERDEVRLLHAMGWETANIHLGTPQAMLGVLRDLSRRPHHWLERSAQAMSEAIESDWVEWKKGLTEPTPSQPPESEP